MDTFTSAYIEAMLWANTVIVEGPEAEPNTTASDGVSFDELSDDTRAKLEQDARDFRSIPYVAELLKKCPEWYGEEEAGHDFALTRNRHGTGFWDRGLPDDLGNKLTSEAQSWGESTIYGTDPTNPKKWSVT